MRFSLSSRTSEVCRTAVHDDLPAQLGVEGRRVCLIALSDFS